MKELTPSTFRAKLIASLTDEKTPAYGQVATVDEKGFPQIRTVHFRYLEETDEIGFAANTKSPKWRQLSQKPFLSGCLYDPHRMIQFRWESHVKLITKKSGDKEQKIRKKLWVLVRPDVRSAYWLDDRGFSVEKLAGTKLDPRRTKFGQKFLELISNTLLKKPCPSFGIVICTPHLWDIMEIDPKDYRRDKRTIYRWQNNEWHSEAVSVLHTGHLK